MMATRADKRRADLIIPYKEPDTEQKDSTGDVAQTMSSTLPMIAMFTRNKMIGWASLVFAVQTWLAQTPEQAQKSGTPGYMSAGMAAMALATTYISLFMPPPPARSATGTEAPSPAPPS